MASNKMAIGWVSAQVGTIFQDGIVAREENLDEDQEIPVDLAWCEPYDGSFVVRFGGPEDEPLYARITTELVDSEGNPL